jgi:hypothetical protein
MCSSPGIYSGANGFSQARHHSRQNPAYLTYLPVRKAIRVPSRRPVSRGVVVSAIIVGAVMIFGIGNAPGQSPARRTEMRTRLRIRDRSEQPKSRQQQKGVPYHKSSS